MMGMNIHLRCPDYAGLSPRSSLHASASGGIAAPVQIVVAPLMLRLSSQKAILVVAMVASTIEMGMLAAAPSTGRAVAYTGIAVGTLGSMAFPIVSALKSVNASQEEQGKVQVRPAT